MTESKVSVATRENLEAEKYFYYMETIREAINLAVEQGLWIALMVDMFAISGKIYKHDEQGKETFLYQQRYHLAKSLDLLTADKIETFVKIPNPLSYVFRFIKPLKNELDKHDVTEDGRWFYRNMDPIPKMILIFMLPGILKLLASQIGELIPG